MKHILEKGEIKELLSDKGEGGWSKEVHLVNYLGEKYVVRRCRDIKRAKKFEFLLKKFGEYNFLPKFYGRFGNDILLEYINGRDLRKKESTRVIEQVGKICAMINRNRIKQKANFRFERWMKSGAEKKLGIEKSEKVKRIYYYLEKRLDVISSFDCGDLNPDNFRLRKGKVYLVDLDSIIKIVKGYGIGKAFTKWFKKNTERIAFKDGYSKISSIDFLTQEYEDYVILYFLIHEIRLFGKFGIKYKPKIAVRFEILDELIKKYE